MKTFSIIITCVNETSSLIKTVDIIVTENDLDIKEIIIVYPIFIRSKTKQITSELAKANKILSNIRGYL